MERQIAIVADQCTDDQVLTSLVDALMANAVCQQITVFTKEAKPSLNKMHERTACQNVVLPIECDTDPKTRNYINKQYRESGFTGFLHVILWNTIIDKDPTDFLLKLEDMMDKLDYNVWFNTICDPCNYVYHKYCPRTYIMLDDPEYQVLSTKRIAFTSHSNTQWIAYNLAKATDSNLHFDEDFTIPMYYIIEFLARRKAEAVEGQLYFMNEYLTVEEEHGVFSKFNVEEKTDQEQLKKEDAIFASKNVKHAADNNVDVVATQFYLKLKTIAK